MTPIILSIRSRIGGEVSFTETIPDCLTGFLIPGAQPILAYCSSGHFLMQEITSPDFSLWHHTVILNKDDQFHISCDRSLLSLNFCLQNNFLLCKNDPLEHLDFHEEEYNMCFFPGIDLTADFSKDRVHSFLTLFYSPGYLSKIAIAYPQLAVLLSKADAGQEAFLYPSNQHVSKEMKGGIFNMLQAGYKDEETAICIKKGRAFEILIQALEFSTHHCSALPIGLTRQDMDKIYLAKDWLDQQYNRPITLFELSRQVGMNVHKLSSGFLQIIGTTVFHYHRKVRMEKAIQLLEETDRDLFDIGTEIGYIDGKTFSKEFKKENGVPPFEYRRQFRVQIK